MNSCHNYESVNIYILNFSFKKMELLVLIVNTPNILHITWKMTLLFDYFLVGIF